MQIEINKLESLIEERKILALNLNNYLLKVKQTRNAINQIDEKIRCLEPKHKPQKKCVYCGCVLEDNRCLKSNCENYNKKVEDNN